MKFNFCHLLNTNILYINCTSCWPNGQSINVIY